MGETSQIEARPADPGDVVLALEQLDGPIHVLHEVARSSGPVFVLRVGKDDHNDIVIRDDDAVADTHCLLVCDNGHVTVQDFHDEPQINDVPVVDASLKPNDVLTVGNTLLVAIGAKVKRRPTLTVWDYDSLYRKMKRFYGSSIGAAEALGVERRTFDRRYAKWVGTAVVLCGLAGAGMWLNSTSSRQGRAVDAPAMPAATPAATGAVSTDDGESAPSVSGPSDGSDGVETLETEAADLAAVADTADADSGKKAIDKGGPARRKPRRPGTRTEPAVGEEPAMTATGVEVPAGASTSGKVTDEQAPNGTVQELNDAAADEAERPDWVIFEVYREESESKRPSHHQWLKSGSSN